MHPFLQNKYVRIIGITTATIFVIFAILLAITSLSSSRSGVISNYDIPYSDNEGMKIQNSFSAPSMGMDGISKERVSEAGSSYYFPPEPNLPGYTSGLEAYETTAYNISGHIKQFNEMCNTLSILKTEPDIHFKNLTSSTNNCSATFYSSEAKADSTLATLSQFKGIETDRSTVSVTRHKERIESQTDIIRRKLSNTERLLTSAEVDFDELVNFAKDSKSAKAYGEAIQEKIRLIDTLTQRQISLTSQLDNLYQQATDLQERLNVVEFRVNIQRLNPIYPNHNETKWLNALNDMEDHFTDTLIGLTAFFVIFLVRAIQAIIYLIVILVIVRGLWKFVKLLWSKW